MKPIIKYIGHSKKWLCFSVMVTPGEERYIIGEGGSPIEAFHSWRLDFNIWQSLSDRSR